MKTLGDALSVKMEKNASGDAKVSWTKVIVLRLGRASEKHQNIEENERVCENRRICLNACLHSLWPIFTPDTSESHGKLLYTL